MDLCNRGRAGYVWADLMGAVAADQGRCRDTGAAHQRPGRYALRAALKPSLLAASRKTGSALTARIHGQTAAQADIKDVIGHSAHWIDLVTGQARDGQARHDVRVRAPGSNCSELRACNAELRASGIGPQRPGVAHRSTFVGKNEQGPALLRPRLPDARRQTQRM